MILKFLGNISINANSMKFLKLIAITTLATVVSLELYFLFANPFKIWETLSQARVELNSQDVMPQSLNNPSFRESSLGGEESFYFTGYIAQNFQEKFDADIVDETYFPYYENSEIHPPKKYDLESNYSAGDIEKMKLVLKIAYRYADINKAIEDGYRIESANFFPSGMGTHVVNIGYVLNDEISLEKPEFLNYVKNRETSRFQLVQLGFISQGDTPYKLFDAKEAQGHFHVGTFCFFEENDIYMQHSGKPIKDKDGNFIEPGRAQKLSIFNQIEDSEFIISKEDCETQAGEKLGPSIRMMHFAVNMYNELGMFTDYFPYIDYLSANAITHSFLGEKLDN